MYNSPTPDELLAAAANDALFQNELLIQAGEESADVLQALDAGIEHPEAAEALAWIKQLVSECREPVATYSAEQDKGRYSIEIYGFDHLCTVWAPEHGTTGPFVSHEAAMSYVDWNWNEFLVDAQPEISRFPSERSRLPPPPATSRKEIEGVPKRYQIGHAKYSSTGPDRYIRHRTGLLSSDETLTTKQLVLRLTKECQGTSIKTFEEQIRASGWHRIAEEVVQAKRSDESERVVAVERSKAALAAEAVAFIDRFLAGREDSDGKLIDVAALEWSWGAQEDHVSEDEGKSVLRRHYARQRYYSALSAYATAKKIRAGKGD